MAAAAFAASVAVAVAVAGPAKAEEQVYYCVKEHAVGIQRKGPVVQGQHARDYNFEASDAYEDLRFTAEIDLSADRPSLRIGGPIPDQFDDCEQVAAMGGFSITVCMGEYGDVFLIDPETMRFKWNRSSLFGWTLGLDPSMIIAGTCETF